MLEDSFPPTNKILEAIREPPVELSDCWKAQLAARLII
jgi:hypothetical protein